MPFECQDCVSRSPVFNLLPEAEIQILQSCKKHLMVTRGEIICDQGSKVEHFLYLQNGLLKVYTDNEHCNTQILSIAKPLDFVGLLSIFSNPVYQYSIAAIEDSCLCFIPIQMIQDLIHRNGDFGLALLQKMSQTADTIIKQRAEINAKNLRGRIAYVLLDFAENVYQSQQFDLPVSRREIGELIDMTTENVIRILSEFRKDNIIEISGKTIHILNLEMLKKISING